KAVELSYAPYMIFGDASLRDMARRRPTTADEFLKVHGVGQKKCDDYADEFTKVIANHCREHDLPTDVEPPPPERLREATARARSNSAPKGPSESARRAFPMFDAGQSIADVARD